MGTNEEDRAERWAELIGEAGLEPDDIEHEGPLERYALVQMDDDGDEVFTTHESLDAAAAHADEDDDHGASHAVDLDTGDVFDAVISYSFTRRTEAVDG